VKLLRNPASRGIAAAMIISLGSIGSSAVAGIVVPTGLSPGSKYYLAFVTQGTHNAVSTNIADYNSFAQSQAALNPSLTGTNEGVTWKALGSTASVSAVSNLGLGEFPIYLLNGMTKIADGVSDLWDGSIDAALNRNQFLGTVDDFVLTGTGSDGNPSLALGNTESSMMSNLIGGTVLSGWTSFTNGFWVAAPNGFDPGDSRRFYAFSSLLTVPAPEPSGATLATWAAVGLLAAGRRRYSSQRLGIDESRSC
jgi:hypothetical protein